MGMVMVVLMVEVVEVDRGLVDMVVMELRK